MTKTAKLADASPKRKKDNLDFFCFDDYDNVIGFVISQAADALGRGLEAIIRRNGITLTPREFVVLNRLHQYGEMSQTQISECSYKDPASTSRIVESLRIKRMVNRKASKLDKRVTFISLTEKGRSAREIIAPQMAEFLQVAAGDASLQELASAMKVMRQIIANAEVRPVAAAEPERSGE